MILKIKKLSNYAILPEYCTENAAALDLYTPSSLQVYAQETYVLGLGISIEISDGYFGMIVARSGVAIRQGLLVKNSPGIIDSDYRGELKVALWNTTLQSISVGYGIRIAQMIILPYEHVVVAEVDELSTTVRGEGGLGSTGE